MRAWFPVQSVAMAGIVLALTCGEAFAQRVEAGRQAFVSRCAGCHGTDGNGGELGPGIATRVPTRTDADLTELFRDGRLAAGMPAFPAFSAADSADLIAFLRTLKPRSGNTTEHRSVRLDGGTTLAGLVLNETRNDVQLLGDDRRLHLLRRRDEASWREVTSQTDWASYDGTTLGTRYSSLKQIDTTNVAKLAPAWMFTIPNTARLQVTPVVVGVSCSLSGGSWVSLYDGVRTTDPSTFDIDHVVALKEAWDSGAWAWSAATRKAYANDTSDSRTLIAVTAPTGRFSASSTGPCSMWAST